MIFIPAGRLFLTCKKIPRQRCAKAQIAVYIRVLMNATTTTYSARQTIKEALTIFFEKYQLGPDGGMSDRWVKLRFGKFYIPIPNTASRKKALIFHDVHHIATGYQSNWKGECEIGAWEVSTGCGSYTAAWLLDLAVFALGLLIFPVATFKAFVRGRRTLNFYRNSYSGAELMPMEIEQVQALLKLNTASNAPASAVEILAFFWWSCIAAVFAITFFFGPYILLIWLLMR